MSRVKRGVTKHQRHKKVLALAKGHRQSRHLLYKRARDSVIKALSHAYRHRRERKGDMRGLWITRINAAARVEGLSYSQLTHGLKLAGVDLNRKVLADIAVRDAEAFSQIATKAKLSLEAA